MNNRREAMGKMFAGLAGAGAALSGSGVQTAKAYPPTIGKAFAPDVHWTNLNEVPQAPSIIDRARQKAASPLEEQIANIRGYGEKQTMTQFFNRESTDHYYDVWACKSTTEFFKRHVIHERTKLKINAVNMLRAEIDKLLTSPLDGLQDTAREAVLGFLAELQK